MGELSRNTKRMMSNRIHSDNPKRSSYLYSNYNVPDTALYVITYWIFQPYYINVIISPT